jgi:hypothetical protein
MFPEVDKFVAELREHYRRCDIGAGIQAAAAVFSVFAPPVPGK